MPTQSELIGNHPAKPDVFGVLFSCTDVPVTATKRHRALSPIPTNNKDLAEWLGKKLIHHHHSDYRIKKLKENYKKLGFEKYAKQHRKLPKADKVKKGNATEILLTEYVESCIQKNLLKVFKLRYNPNVDQAIKGDDTLMVDLISSKKIKVYLGEAKFRRNPTKQVVETIAKSLSKDKRPLSYSFLVDELGKNKNTEKEADILDGFILDEVKGKSDLIYVGFLLSDENTFSVVENSLNSNNPNMLLISIGIKEPEKLINDAFIKAEYIFKHPAKV